MRLYFVIWNHYEVPREVFWSEKNKTYMNGSLTKESLEESLRREKQFPIVGLNHMHLVRKPTCDWNLSKERSLKSEPKPEPVERKEQAHTHTHTTHYSKALCAQSKGRTECALVHTRGLLHAGLLWASEVVSERQNFPFHTDAQKKQSKSVQFSTRIDRNAVFFFSDWIAEQQH